MLNWAMKRPESVQVRGTADAQGMEAVSQSVSELTYREQEGIPREVPASGKPKSIRLQPWWQMLLVACPNLYPPLPP